MQHRILVLGAGYSGAIAAGRLARRLHGDDVAITIVNAEPDFVERVRLHQVAAGQTLPRRRLVDMFADTGVDLRLGRVDAVDVAARTVTLTGGTVLEYNTLVYALGSTTDHGIGGAAAHADSVAGPHAAARTRDRIAALGAGGRVVVVGGGLTGIEAATEFAEARPDLAVSLLVRGGLGDWLAPKARRHLRAVCDRLGVTVHDDTTVSRVTDAGVTTGSGAVIPADVTVMTTGFVVHPIARGTSLSLADSGRILVDRTMRSVSHPEVYAVGDAAVTAGPNGLPLRMSCASGSPMAWQAADAIAARLTGRPVPTVPVRYFNQCISLGRRDGIIQFVTADDRAKPAALTGRIAARYKEVVCRGAAWGVAHPLLGMPTRRRRVTASGRAVAAAR